MRKVIKYGFLILAFLLIVGGLFIFNSPFFKILVLPLIHDPLTGKFFPECGYSYTELPIPEKLKGTEIIFDAPVYGRENGDFSRKCLSFYAENTNGKVNYLNTYEFGDKLPEGEKFSIYKRIYINCSNIGCADAGGGGDKLYLKDESGLVWELDTDTFSSSSFSKAEAHYYKEGVKIGKVFILPRTIDDSAYSWKE